MDATRRELLMQRWNVLQHDLIPELNNELGALTPKLEKVIHTLEWVRIEEFVESSWQGLGRPPHERAWLANAFVAKTVLGITTTVGLIERLRVDRALRRICGFALWRKLPSEATFSRAFAEFAEGELAQRAHGALIEEHLGEELIGHLSRDATAIAVRERPAKPAEAEPEQGEPAWVLGGQLELSAEAPPAPGAKGKRRGERKRAERGRRTRSKRNVRRQRQQSLPQMLEEIPRACDRGSKSNAQGYKSSWNGYKLHLDTADCGVPVAALLSSASMHDALAAIPLSLISAARVTNLYDLMDSAYCSADLHEHSRSLNHVPLIDHNPRGGPKEEFEPADAIRYRERSVAERTNARLKDEFGARHITVRGAVKVMSHLMFGVLALAADQLMRLQL
jgi:hypothetical protein